MKESPGGLPGGKRGSKMSFLSLEKSRCVTCLEMLLNDRYFDYLSFFEEPMSGKNMILEPGGKKWSKMSF